MTIFHNDLPDAGSLAHNTIDLLLPTHNEKNVLQDLANDGTILIRTSTANTSNPPTDAQLDAAFGTPATVGAGFLALLDDNGGNANVYLVLSNGTSWWYVGLTKAT
jgi:hypothetical protein